MRRISAEYAAGFFDGEGCVRVAKNRRAERIYPSGNRREDFFEYGLAASIAQSYRPILSALSAQWGGLISPQKSHANKAMWEWKLGRKAAVRFLREIFPYVRVKSLEVWLALNFDSDITQNRRGPGVRLSEEELALREGYYLALRQAKKEENYN